jgi:dipeptidase
VWAAFNRVKKGFGDQYLDYAMGKNLKNRMPLWIKPDEKLSVHDVMELMRDHYENTPMDMNNDIGAGPYKVPIRWRPMTWKINKDDKDSYIFERATSTMQTGFSFVTQSRSWLPAPVGGIFWFGVDDSYTTVYTPMYSSMTQVPSCYAVGNGSMMEFSDSSGFWLFNQVSNFAYTRWVDMIPEIRELQKELELSYINNTGEIDSKAVEFFNENPELAVKFLTDYSVAKGAQTFAAWKKLYAHLFTKFMDGNIKTIGPGDKFPKVSQPGYSPEWYKIIVKETGDRFKVIGESGH